MTGDAGQKPMDRTKIYETIFSSPGLHESCKIVLSPTRQTILVLARLIENGIEKREGGDPDEMISFLSEEALRDLKSIMEEVLKKGGLVEFYQHLKQL